MNLFKKMKYLLVTLALSFCAFSLYAEYDSTNGSTSGVVSYEASDFSQDMALQLEKTSMKMHALLLDLEDKQQDLTDGREIEATILMIKKVKEAIKRMNLIKVEYLEGSMMMFASLDNITDIRSVYSYIDVSLSTSFKLLGDMVRSHKLTSILAPGRSAVGIKLSHGNGVLNYSIENENKAKLSREINIETNFAGYDARQKSLYPGYSSGFSVDFAISLHLGFITNYTPFFNSNDDDSKESNDHLQDHIQVTDLFGKYASASLKVNNIPFLFRHLKIPSASFFIGHKVDAPLVLVQANVALFDIDFSDKKKDGLGNFTAGVMSIEPLDFEL